MGSTEDPNSERPPHVEETDLLYDRRTEALYQVVAVAKDGVVFRRNNTEYYIPHRSWSGIILTE